MIDTVSNILNYTSSTETDDTPSDEMGKEEFLQLLVSQLKNQDPLEPMDNAEFVSQMTEFTTLEQLINMNENLTSSLNLDYMTSQSIANSMATSLIDKTITAASDQIYLDDSGNAEINYELASAASEVKITIYDDAGNIVDVIYDDDNAAGMNSAAWDGKSQYGAQMSEGNYTAVVEATASDGTEIEADLYVIGKADKVQYLDGAAYLLVNNTMIALGNVVEVEG